MNTFLNPPRAGWEEILKRPYADGKLVWPAVQQILASVKAGGDAALRELTQKLDGAALQSLAVTQAEFEAAEKAVPADLKTALAQAKKNIETVHVAQRQDKLVIETAPGVQCWRKAVPIEKVGLYIPGGTAPLFSTVLMLGVPAQLAGCATVVLCSPPDNAGQIHPAILYAAMLCGIKKVYKAGGAQAVAAMAFGTETIPAVYKIFGPGNQYVTAAKLLVQQEGVAIDMPAGPSEVCVLADATAVPVFVAADLLSQAEHGRDSQVVLVSTSQEIMEQTLRELDAQLAHLPRKNIAAQALQNSKAIFINSMPEAIDLVNAYAAEHLILACADAEKWAEQITAAGSVFIGNYAPESAGDYASGTNHTLPTNAAARAYSGVSLESFQKNISFQKASKEGLAQIAETVVTMAEAEGLQAHAAAVRLRLQANG